MRLSSHHTNSRTSFGLFWHCNAGKQGYDWLKTELILGDHFNKMFSSYDWTLTYDLRLPFGFTVRNEKMIQLHQHAKCLGQISFYSNRHTHRIDFFTWTSSIKFGEHRLYKRLYIVLVPGSRIHFCPPNQGGGQKLITFCFYDVGFIFLHLQTRMYEVQTLGLRQFLALLQHARLSGIRLAVLAMSCV